MKLHICPHSREVRAAAAAALVLAATTVLSACTPSSAGHPGVADTATDPGGHHVASGPYIRTEQVPPVIADVPAAPAAPAAPGAGSGSQPTLPAVRSMVRLLGPADPAVLHHDICTGVSYAGPHAITAPGSRMVRFDPRDFTDAQLAVRSAVGIGGINTEGYNIRAWMRGDTAAAMASPACKAGR